MAIQHEGHPAAAALNAYASGELPPQQATTVEAHLSTCVDCVRALEQQPADKLVQLARQAKAPTQTMGTKDFAAAQQSVSGSTTTAQVPAELQNHQRYRVLRLLGEGGMGQVFLAEHQHMGRTVALKVIGGRSLQRSDALPRFQKEVRAAAQLSHPNIVQAYDADHAGDLHFLVMEFVEGTDLSSYLQRTGKLPVQQACHFALQTALGLQHAHEHGMVHRDIKPSNLMLTKKGQVKILDFGLARLGHAESPEAGQLTGSGVMMGTADYVAPEQSTSAHDVDIRADIYSLGCTLYQLLAGQVPYPGGTAIMKVMRHHTEKPAGLASLLPEVPKELVAIVEKMMAQKAADRFQTPAEVVKALRPFAVNRPAAVSTSPLSTAAPARLPVATFAALAVVLPPTQEVMPTPTRPRRGNRRLLIAALVGVAALILVAVGFFVLRVKTKDGELVITAESPDVEISVLKNGKEVHFFNTRTKKRITLPVGEYELAIKGNPPGVRLKATRIEITEGDDVLATVEKIPAVAEPKRPDPPKTSPFDELYRDKPAGEVFQFQIPSVESMVLVEDGTQVLIGCSDGIHRYDLMTGRLQAKYPTLERIESLSYCQKTRQFASGGARVLLWHIDQAEPIRTFFGNKYAPTVALSPDGNLIAFNAPSKGAQVLDLHSDKKVVEIGAHCRNLCFTSDVKALFVDAGPYQRNVSRWNLVTGKEDRNYAVQTSRFSLSVTPNGERFIVCHGAEIWDAVKGFQIGSLSDVKGVTLLALSPNGDIGLSQARQGSDGPLWLWSIEDRKQIAQLEGQVSVKHAAFTPDGKYAVTAGVNDRTVRIWKLPLAKTKAGDLVVTAQSPDVEITVRKNGDEVLTFNTKTKKKISLPVGEYELAIKGSPPGVRLTATKIDVRDGAEVLATVENVPAVTENDSRKEVTLNGKITCAKCELGIEKACATVIVVRADEKNSVFFLDEKSHRVNHKEICAKGKEGRVTGAISKGTIIVATKVEFTEDSKDPAKPSSPDIAKEKPTTKELQLFLGHEDQVAFVAFVLDGKAILSASKDGTMRLWNASDGKQLQSRKLENWGGHLPAVSPNRRNAVVADANGKLVCWDIESFKESWLTELGPYTHLFQLDFTEDGAVFFATYRQGASRVALWNADTGKQIRKSTISSDFRIAISRDGKRMVGHELSSQPRLGLWDAVSGAEIRLQPLEPRFSDVKRIAFSSDGKRVQMVDLACNSLTASADALEELSRRQSDKYVHDCLMATPDFRHALGSLASSKLGGLDLLDLSSGKTIHSFQAHTQKVASADVSPDGKYIVSGSQDRTIRLWSVPKSIDLTGGVNSQPRPSSSMREFAGHGGVPARQLLFSPKGDSLYSCGDDHKIRTWDVATGKEGFTYEGHKSPVVGIALSEDEGVLVSCSRDGDVNVWANGKLDRTLQAVDPRGVAVAMGGKLIGYADGKRGLLAWGWLSKQDGPLNPVTVAASSVAFSPDGRRVLVSVLPDDKGEAYISLLNSQIQGGGPRFKGQRSEVRRVAISPSTTLLATGGGNADPGSSAMPGDDVVIRIWDLQEKPVERQRPPKQLLSSHTHTVTGVAFSPDSKKVISASGDRTIRLWDVDTGKELWKADAPTPLLDAAFSPTGKEVAAAGLDGKIRLWRLPDEFAPPPSK